MVQDSWRIKAGKTSDQAWWWWGRPGREFGFLSRRTVRVGLWPATTRKIWHA